MQRPGQGLKILIPLINFLLNLPVAAPTVGGFTHSVLFCFFFASSRTCSIFHEATSKFS